MALNTLNLTPIYGIRVKKSKVGVISWFFYCGEYCEKVDFYQSLHTKHLNALLPEVMKYPYLFEGYHFIIDRDGYEDV
ncbi:MULTISPECIES: immunity protein Imm33 domain-containing protein [Proteus]|jgi:hypothetical protein|uniref:Imm33-like domain-containing protein n=1 Tax=Proteus vulgaris TaxID=585 RepID=A0A379F4K3_PROVU|nr:MULTISPECIES: hypothetical protein [Proteus]NBN61159.1 hypothetical protein [Proteus sp. G2639]RNT29405.1 hypothetical protein B9475_009190 [Proteus mirabilis]AYY80345.1 hypothetical protein EGX81_05460 [Proteus vulgaris]KGA59309.1 hypothetical protein DR95_1119 [Proteus vulgaris]MBG5971297.1 hypothetical protein [Proteus vulgaris]